MRVRVDCMEYDSVGKDGLEESTRHTIIHRIQPHALFQETVQHRHFVTDSRRVQCRLAGYLLPDEINVFGTLAEFEEGEIEVLLFLFVSSWSGRV